MTKRLGAWLGVLLAVGLLGGSLLPTSVPSAWAGSATWSGTLSGSSPTYHRLAGGNCTTLGGSNGDSVYYATQTFTVEMTGTYTLNNDSNTFTQVSGGQPNDGFFTLFQTTFDPSDARTNCLQTADDVDGDNRRPHMVIALTAGVTYILVTSPFSDTSTGDYSNSIVGPGNISGSGLTTVDNTPTPTITLTRTVTNTPTQTLTATVTTTTTLTSTLTTTLTPTSTLTPTVTVTTTPTVTQTATASVTSTVTTTPTVTPTNTANRLTVIAQVTQRAAGTVFTVTATGTPTAAPTVTQTRTPNPSVPQNRLTVFAIQTQQAGE